MRFTITMACFLLGVTMAKAQHTDFKWYSETNNNGIIIQNSFPKGGPYKGATKQHFNYSYLVFFSRVINNTKKPFKLELNFAADSIGIPNSPNTFVKLFLPPDTMTLDKLDSFSYGVTQLESFDNPTRFKSTLNSGEDCLFYVVAIFYQTASNVQNQGRGGNRAELVLKGQELFYTMSPQLDSMRCGFINFID